MKKTSITKIAVLLTILMMFFSVPATAAVEPSVIEKSANSLVKLGIMKGDLSGNLKLDSTVTRCEFVTMVIRVMGYDSNTDNVKMEFKDITEKHWAYDFIKIAVKNKLINGYTDNTVRPDNVVNYAEAQAILLRTLGYEDTLVGKWPENVLNKSSELALNKGISMEQYKPLTRGEASVLIYNYLTIPFN